jgi:hypothetical protein
MIDFTAEQVTGCRWVCHCLCSCPARQVDYKLYAARPDLVTEVKPRAKDQLRKSENHLRESDKPAKL